MSTLYSTDFTDAAVGTNVTTGNPGAPTALTFAETTGGTLVRDATPGTLYVPRWVKISYTSANACDIGWTLASATNKATMRAYYYYQTGDNSGSPRIMALSTATPTVYADLRHDSTGKLILANNAGATVWTSTGTLGPSNVYWIEMYLDNTGGAGATKVTVNTYLAGSTTPIANLSYTSTTMTTGTGAIARAYLGAKFGTLPGTGHGWFGGFAAEDGIYAGLGPASTSSANAGADTSGNEPLDSITLDGSQSVGSTFSWAFTSGTNGSTATVDQPTQQVTSFTAPANAAGTALTFTLTVDGAVSDTVVHTILSQNEWRYDGSAWQPASAIRIN